VVIEFVVIVVGMHVQAKAKEAEAQSLAKKNEELRCVVSDQVSDWRLAGVCS